MAAVIMVDSGSQGTTVAMTHGTGSNKGLYYHTYSEPQSGLLLLVT